MEERFDILDATGNKTGETRTQSEAHKLGLIHRTVHVWFVNSKGQILLQQRSKQNSVNYPGYWDISAAGHISAGQISIEAAVRETHEELGILLPQSNFKFLFTLEGHAILNGGTYIDNEFSDVYLVRSDLALSEFTMDPGELDDIRWLDKAELEKWIAGDGQMIVPHPEEYKKLFEYLAVNK